MFIFFVDFRTSTENVKKVSRLHLGHSKIPLYASTTSLWFRFSSNIDWYFWMFLVLPRTAVVTVVSSLILKVCVPTSCWVPTLSHIPLYVTDSFSESKQMPQIYVLLFQVTLPYLNLCIQSSLFTRLRSFWDGRLSNECIRTFQRH